MPGFRVTFSRKYTHTARGVWQKEDCLLIMFIFFLVWWHIWLLSVHREQLSPLERTRRHVLTNTEAKEGQVLNHSTCATFRSKKKNSFAEHHSNITEIIQRVSHPHSNRKQLKQDIATGNTPLSVLCIFRPLQSVTMTNGESHKNMFDPQHIPTFVFILSILKPLHNWICSIQIYSTLQKISVFVHLQ